MNLFADSEVGEVRFRSINLDQPNLFTVPLPLYAYQPWSNRHPNLSQWFNYGLTPTTWGAYCQQQIRFAYLNKHGK